MEGLENLIEKILADAERDCKEILKKAEAEAEEMVNQAEAEATRRMEEIIQRSQVRAEENARRIWAQAEGQVRLAWEKARAGLIEEIFREAEEALRDLPEDRYLDWVSGALRSATVSGDEEVILSDRDRERFGDALISRVNAELQEAGLSGNLRLSTESRDISGGFILVTPNMEVNCSFEALLAENREELEEEIAGFLFGSKGAGGDGESGGS